MKTIVITYTDGDVLRDGPYSERVAKQYADNYKFKKRSKSSGIKSVRVINSNG